MEKLSLVCIGDKADFDSFKRLHKERKRFSNSSISYHALSYKDLLSGKIPKIKTGKVLFFLFFPFDYWDKKIETKHYKGIYGSGTFYKKFHKYFEKVSSSIAKNFSDKEIYFVNSPPLSVKYRDKLSVKKLLLNKGVPTSRLCGVSKIEDIYKYLGKNRSIFIKARYGSMGKGITFVSPSTWKTNFVFRNNKILSRKSDYGWRFRNITGNKNFLKSLIQKNIYAEEAVDFLLLNGRKFDLRAYVFFDKVLFIYPKSNDPDNITTNISQDGQGEYPAFLRSVPKTVIEKVKKTAVKAVKMLGLNFAGVDFLVSSDLKNIYIVDVNVFPGFPNRKIYNLARHLSDQLKKQATSQYL